MPASDVCSSRDNYRLQPAPQVQHTRNVQPKLEDAGCVAVWRCLFADVCSGVRVCLLKEGALEKRQHSWLCRCSKEHSCCSNCGLAAHTVALGSNAGEALALHTSQWLCFAGQPDPDLTGMTGMWRSRHGRKGQQSPLQGLDEPAYASKRMPVVLSALCGDDLEYSGQNLSHCTC